MKDRLMECLLSLEEFNDGYSLRSVFVTTDLIKYRNIVPVAKNKFNRAEQTITMFQNIADLITFLLALLDRHDETDMRHSEILRLINELKRYC